MVENFTHDYVGWNGVHSRCNVTILSDKGKHFIWFENIGIGVSVTNASEMLATQIVAKYDLNPKDCRFFESYQEYDNDTFDEIEYRWEDRIQIGKTNKEAKNPVWKPAPEAIRDLFLN